MECQQADKKEENSQALKLVSKEEIDKNMSR